MNQAEQFTQLGWCKFPHDTRLEGWLTRAVPAALQTLEDPEQARWLRYQGTWFAGVNALPNDLRGAVNDSGPLLGSAVDFIAQQLGFDAVAWDKAQVSICYPGYPQPMEGQSEGLHRFRRDRDAAHVDGLLPEGPNRRRFLREFHLFILGIPMSRFSANASPFVVWERSHEIVRAALQERFEGIASADWGKEDITEAYQQARQRAFDECRRVEIYSQPGEAFLAHRLAVHGMAPWGENAEADSNGRVICYFRPEGEAPNEWLDAP
ncbi:MAG: hypothetical protein AAF420_07595 [Pseudomonadota bacterium]